MAGCLLFPPPPDVEFDAGPGPDAAIGDITVIVSDGSTPTQDVPVLIHSPDGAWIETLRTDALGRVVQEIVSGSIVTVIGERNFTPRLWTIYAVEPGDVLTFEDAESNIIDTVADVSLSWPTPPGDCPIRIQFCGNQVTPQASPALLQVPQSCVRDGIVWFAASCDAATPSHHRLVSLDLIEGTTTYAVDIGSFSTEIATSQVAFSGLGGGAVAGTFSLQAVGGEATFWGTTADASTGAIWERAIPASPADGYREQVQITAVGGTGISSHGYAMNTSALRDGITEDVDSFVPMLRITERVVDPRGRHRLAWEPLAPLPETVDGLLAHEDRWVLVLPPDASSLVYPELPAEFDELRERLRPSGSIKAFDVSNISSYRDFRSGAHSVRDMGNVYDPKPAEAPPRGVRWDWGYGQVDPTDL